MGPSVYSENRTDVREHHNKTFHSRNGDLGFSKKFRKWHIGNILDVENDRKHDT